MACLISKPLRATITAPEEQCKPAVVVAIDFGTTYSGYAVSFHDKKIITGKTGGQLRNDRIPTAILLNSDKTFHSFGYEAIEDYGDLSEDERKEHYFIEHFKMALYRTKRLSKESSLPDRAGRSIDAMHVFSLAIQYFRDLALEAVRRTIFDSNDGIIQWMLTIPAIGSDSAKQFMREAAIKAGIRSTKLRLVLEPEAASLFLQEQKVISGAARFEKLAVGHKYILADLGGGTVDICVHEVLAEGKLRELYRATGGDFGGTNVNSALILFLKDLVGEEVWNVFVEKAISGYFEMMERFNTIKSTFGCNTKSVPIGLNSALLLLVDKMTKTSLNCILQNKPYNNLVTLERGKLTFKYEKMEQFFESSLTGLISKLREILQTQECADIQTLFLVGGFAGSPYLRSKLQSQFSSLRCFLNQDTSLAVLKGAVMMGYKPMNIMQRKAMFTYGHECRIPFELGKHPNDLKKTEDGMVWCYKSFYKLITKGQLLEYGDTFVLDAFMTTRPDTKFKELVLQLWKSKQVNPSFCLEEYGCELVGRVNVEPPLGGWPDYSETKTQLIVGETEFAVKTVNKTTKQVTKTRVDFL